MDDGTFEQDIVFSGQKLKRSLFPLASDSEFNGNFCLLVFFSHV